MATDSGMPYGKTPMGKVVAAPIPRNARARAVLAADLVDQPVGGEGSQRPERQTGTGRAEPAVPQALLHKVEGYDGDHQPCESKNVSRNPAVVAKATREPPSS